MAAAAAAAASFNPAQRHTYTPAQIQLYYERIQLPSAARHISVSEIANTSEGLEFLTLLQKYQLANVPFENLELHYSTHHTITLDPEHLFHKIVERNAGRGGYCMENSELFAIVLRSLGFQVRSIGAKVNEAVQGMAQAKNWKGPIYDGWNHMVNLVTIEGKKYLLDVGMGSTGPMHPIPLLDNHTMINVGSQSLRLRHTSLPDFSDQSQKVWQYEIQHSPSSPWLPAYAFTELEFTPRDFQTMNWFTSTHRLSWFTYVLVCVRMVLEEDEIVGDVTLVGNEVKRRIRGETTTLAVCGNEEERVKALDEFLGVKLSKAEIGGIRGMQTEIS